ncbi:hypothetical protein MKY48_28160 [Paenibacillus sp. FSL W8-0187]|uniref:hypothetical protein n=1 Tax=unclassified Paenibacillus TaxID=185978 RepID=UPI0030DB8DC5
MNIGSKIYFDKSTGDVILNTGERTGWVVETTREQDFKAYTSLSKRVPETVGMIQLEYGAYTEDYAAGGRITRVDLETLKPLFTYPDPTNPETPQEPQPPLTEQMSALKTENETLKNRVSDVEMTITEILFS